MTLAEVDTLAPGTQLWLLTGTYTATRVELVEVRGSGAVRRPVVRALERAPGQGDGEFAVTARNLVHVQ